MALGQAGNVAAGFGDAFQRTQALQTIGYDSFHRMYVLNLADGFKTAPRHSIENDIPTNVHTAQLVLDNGPARLSLTVWNPAGPSSSRG